MSFLLSYQKPGRELINFLIVVDFAMWFVYTFEHKEADEFIAGPHAFKDRCWPHNNSFERQKRNN